MGIGNGAIASDPIQHPLAHSVWLLVTPHTGESEPAPFWISMSDILRSAPPSPQHDAIG